jgi:hypothetical protein
MMRIFQSLVRPATVAPFILISYWTLAAQPSTDVIEQLKRQYVPAILFDPVSNTSVVSVDGTILTLRQGGVKANPEFIPGYTPNIYAPGGPVSQPASPAVRGRRPKQLPGSPNTEELPPGTKVFVTAIGVTDDAVNLSLQTCANLHPEVPMKHRAAVTFQFQAGFVNPSNLKQILDAIDGLLAITEQPVQISGVYLNPAASSTLLLDPDGSFAIKQSDQTVLSGRYAYKKNVTQSNVELSNIETGATITVTLHDGRITDGEGRVWTRQGIGSDAAPAAQESAPRQGGSSDIVHAGQTMDEVKGLLGPPDKIENANGKVVYIYTGLKITFAGAKVVAVQ